MDMQYIVYGKRFGGEHLDIREFITPSTPSVKEVLKSIPQNGNVVWACWDWVCRNISYPPAPNRIQDYHEKISFLNGNPIVRMPLKRSVNVYDFWELPWEVLDPPRYGDCEGSAMLLVSMLRNHLSPGEVYCTIGTYEGSGHAWVTVVSGGSRYTLDTTKPQAAPGGALSIAEDDPYVPYIRFNDQCVEVEREGWQEFLNHER